MKKSLPFFAILICAVLVTFVLQRCGSSTAAKKGYFPSKPQETNTTVTIVVNPFINDYRNVTAHRTIRDTTKFVTNDTTDGKITQEMKAVKDTSYAVNWPIAVQDSLKHTIKSKINKLADGSFSDSVIWRFVPVTRNVVIQDLNTSF